MSSDRDTSETFWLGLRHAAVDEELDPGDVAAVVRGEKHYRLRDLFRLPQPAQRHCGRQALLGVVPEATQARRVDRPGADALTTCSGSVARP